jgi:hypothetical protein
MRSISVTVLAGLLLMAAGSAVPAAEPELAPSCYADLDALDGSFGETLARLEKANGAGHDEVCAAYLHHIDVMMRAREVFLRCLPEGRGKVENVGQMEASIDDFRYLVEQKSCP